MTDTGLLPGLAVTGTEDFPDWSQALEHAVARVPDAAVTAAWRALNYLAAAQLYLRDNVAPVRPLRREDVKEMPSGHWGVCPPVNWMLAHLGPLTAWRPPGSEVLIVHGAGHAGPSALAHAYLTKNLTLTGNGPGWSTDDIRALAAGFPHTRAYGGEITPLIPGVRYTGGQLGPAARRRAGHGPGRPAPPGGRAPRRRGAGDRRRLGRVDGPAGTDRIRTARRGATSCAGQRPADGRPLAAGRAR